MRVAIIGAGISGISAAKELQYKGIETVVFEQRSRSGGLIQCDLVDGNLFHKVGGHVFNAKDKIVADWFWKHFDREKEFVKAERNAKIWLQGKYVGYPIENHLYSLEPSQVGLIVKELLDQRAKGYKDPFSYANFEDFLKGNFGPTLYELYFKPYNQKIWKTDLTTVPMHWLEGKLPMPDIFKVLVSNITREGEKEMVHSTFYYPLQGGSQFIIERLAEGLAIRHNHTVEDLEYEKGKWKVDNEGNFDWIIFTGNIRNLDRLMAKNIFSEETKTTMHNLKDLRSNGTSNMLCYTDDTDLSWLYLPDPNTSAHRIIYTGNFSTHNNSTDRKTCVVEFSGSVSDSEMSEELKKLPGNLVPIRSNQESNSYVIQDSDTRTKIAGFKKIMSPYKFLTVGRFAEWEYYNMDKAIENALKIVVDIEAKSN